MSSPKEGIIRGFKFLNPNGATIYDGKEYPYVLPQPGEKWGAWFKHPNPGKADGKPCGSGGWHISKRLNDEWGYGRYPWFAEGRGILGENTDKIRVIEIRLRRVSRKIFEKLLRIGWAHDASLDGASLDGALLNRASLNGASLDRASLNRASLNGASLNDASLDRASLNRASLNRASLDGASLDRASLNGANLEHALFLDMASWKDARYDQYTKWPKGFNPKLKKYGMIEVIS